MLSYGAVFAECVGELTKSDQIIQVHSVRDEKRSSCCSRTFL
jgi:hypothetical protein